MKLTALVIAALLSAAPVFAQEPAKSEAKQHADAPRSFDKQPPVGTWAKCPVSGDVFQVNKDTGFATRQGRVYAFCCPDCKPDFLKHPAKYAEPRRG